MIYKRNSLLIVSLVILVGIVAIAGIYAFALYKDAGRPKHFRLETEARATLLYEDVVNRDYKEDYPPTVEEVMELYSKGYELIYGNMIIDEEVFNSVVEAQRKLYTKELLAENSYDDQLVNLSSGLEKLSELNVICQKFECKAPIYDPTDNTYCMVRVIEYFSNGEKIYFNYYLIKDRDSNRWAINSWEWTNDAFVPITEIPS